MAFLDAKPVDSESIFEELLPLVKRNFVLMVILFVVAVAGVYVTLVSLSNKYESEALMLVMLGRENSQAPVTAENANIFIDGVQAEEINSYVGLLSSRSLIEETVDAIGVDRFEFVPPKPEGLLDHAKHMVRQTVRWTKKQANVGLIYIGLRPKLSDREQVVKLLEESLVAARERDSNVIRLSLRLPDAALARDTLSKLLDIYADRHISVRQNENVYAAFQLQTEDYRRELDELSNRMKDIRAEWNITSVETQASELASALIQAELDLEKQNSERARLLNQQATLQTELVALAASRKQLEEVEENPTVTLLKAELTQTHVKRIEAVNSPIQSAESLKNLDAKIAELEALIRAEAPENVKQVVYTPNPLVDDMEMTLSSLRSEIAGLVAANQEDAAIVAGLKEKIAKINEGAEVLKLAELEYGVMEERFKSSVDRLEQVKTKQQLDAQRVANIAVIGGPTLSEDPVAPRRLLLMGVGVFVALALSFGVVLLKEWMGARVYSRREIEAIPGVEFLGKFRLHGSSEQESSAA